MDLRLVAFPALFVFTLAVLAPLPAQELQHKSLSTPGLKPAEGASVKILAPKAGEAFQSDEVPIHFRLFKGKKGSHVHAYVDGELMGMFATEKGTLTGIKPGEHTLELRVVSEDHETELDASDRARFVVK